MKPSHFLRKHLKPLIAALLLSFAIVVMGLASRLLASKEDTSQNSVLTDNTHRPSANVFTADSLKASHPRSESILKADDAQTQLSSAHYPLPSEIFQVAGVTFKMIRVKGGTFQMGAEDELKDEVFEWEMPAHEVTLPDYMIGETEVTQELWEAVMGNNPSKHIGANLPVEKVSWNDCQQFIQRLNNLTHRSFRLPKEAEWEFAARGGNESRHYCYSGSDTLNEVGWYFDNSNFMTHPIGTKRPNELGLYDMSGNVREWCDDKFYYYNPSVDTSFNDTTIFDSHMNRGGGLFCREWDCRVSERIDEAPDTKHNYLGFRLAL